MGVAAPVDAKTEELRLRTIAEMREFVQPHRGWQAAFDAEIASSLEENSFPRLPTFDSRTRSSVMPPARPRTTAAPSAALLALLQAMARERLLMHVHGKM